MAFGTGFAGQGMSGLFGGLGKGIGAISKGIGGLFADGGRPPVGVASIVGERGPEIVTAGTKSTVTANNDLKDTFDTAALETKMSSMITELNSANKTLTNMVNGVNTLVAVESRALKAVEKTARKDVNQIGMV